MGLGGGKEKGLSKKGKRFLHSIGRYSKVIIYRCDLLIPSTERCGLFGKKGAVFMYFGIFIIAVYYKVMGWGIFPQQGCVEFIFSYKVIGGA